VEGVEKFRDQYGGMGLEPTRNGGSRSGSVVILSLTIDPFKSGIIKRLPGRHGPLAVVTTISLHLDCG